MTSVMNYPIHDYPFDYWRYTPEAFKSLLKNFDSVFVTSVGQKDFPSTIVGIGVKGVKNYFKNKKDFHAAVAKWKFFYRERRSTKLYNLIIPKILQSFFRQIKLLIRKIIVMLSPSLRGKIVRRLIYK